MATKKARYVTRDELIGTGAFMMKRITEALVKAETCRILMIQHGVCSEDAFVEMEAYVQKHWDSSVVKAISEGQAQAHDEEMRRLLESHEGKRH